MAAGKKIGCFALTEPNAGSDPDVIESKAKPDGDYYILNGSKTWITNAGFGDVFIVWAKDEKKVLRGFILEKGMPGLSTPQIEGKLSLCASDTAMVMMDNVKVHKSMMLPNVKGLKGPLETLTNGRFSIAWACLGSAEACFHYARQYALERKQFGTPLAQFQLVQKKLAEMCSEISLGLCATLHVSRLKDKGLLAPEMVAILKANNSLKALNVARTARDILGGNGIVDEYEVMRHLVNLESVYTYEGTYDINMLMLGRSITGLNAFSRK